MPLHLVEHPLAQHALTQLRDLATPPETYRHLTRTLATVLVLEATRSLATGSVRVRTPLEECEGLRLAQGLAVVPVLRAGLAMVESALALFPDVAVGYIGLERDEETARAHRYYCKLPRLAGRLTLCCDPMLATGGSASQAVGFLKGAGADRIAMLSVVAAPEGVEHLSTVHPELPIYAAALDRELDERKYILPGLGDFGDRLYGTMSD